MGSSDSSMGLGHYTPSTKWQHLRATTAIDKPVPDKPRKYFLTGPACSDRSGRARGKTGLFLALSLELVGDALAQEFLVCLLFTGQGHNLDYFQPLR